MWKRGVTLSFIFIICGFLNTVSAEEGGAIDELILEELNRVRADADLSFLTVHPLLSFCASDYAAASSDKGYLSHVNDAGMRAVERFRERGGTSLRVGEVLGSCPPDKVGELFEQWLESPSHRGVLLDDRWTHCGVGAAAGVPAVRTKPESERLFVVIQCIEHPFTDITVEKTGERVVVHGNFNLPDNVSRSIPEDILPLIKTGTTVIRPEVWNREEKRFSFALGGEKQFYYLYLGYTTGGRNVLYTDTYSIFYEQQNRQY